MIGNILSTLSGEGASYPVLEAVQNDLRFINNPSEASAINCGEGLPNISLKGSDVFYPIDPPSGNGQACVQAVAEACVAYGGEVAACAGTGLFGCVVGAAAVGVASVNAINACFSDPSTSTSNNSTSADGADGY